MWLFLLEVRRHIACRMADEARLFARNCGLEAINIGSNSKFATIRRLFSIFRKLSGTGKKNANISRSVFFTEPEFYQVLLYRVLLYLYRDIELRVIQRGADYALSGFRFGQRRPPDETKSAELPSRQVVVPLQRGQMRSPAHLLGNVSWHIRHWRFLTGAPAKVLGRLFARRAEDMSFPFNLIECRAHVAVRMAKRRRRAFKWFHGILGG